MNLGEKVKLLAHLVRWRLTWAQRDLDYSPAQPVSDKFITARQAAQRIPDGAAVLSCGMAGNARCATFFWAIREAFERHGHPRDLTWINVGAQGGRGRVPGTVEELGLRGLVTRYVSGHVETAKSMLCLAEEGELELYTMPQGLMSLLLVAQGRGEDTIRSTVGVGTFLDPRVGPGCAVSPNAPCSFITAAGDALIYRLPKLDVALFNAPYADPEGNVYFKHAATITENIQATEAVRASRGLVMATVSAVIPKNEAEIDLPVDRIDAIVVNPRNEQTLSVLQRRYWPMLTVGSHVDVKKAEARLKFINKVLHVTPIRGEAEDALARLVASRFVREIARGAIVNIGGGFPEEVCRVIFDHGLADDLVFTTEAGVYGGLPAPGVFFGAAINPQRMETSAWMFELYQNDLDVAVLGFLQVDAEGNVNVSRRSPRVLDYVGPGGFPDIVHGARTIFFVGAWMHHARFAIQDGRFVVEALGRNKFVDRVDEISFNGRQALQRGKKVFYVTNVGVFKLTEHGLTLIEIMPGLDVQRDVVAPCAARIVLPEDGSLEVVDRTVVTGEGFRLCWPGRET